MSYPRQLLWIEPRGLVADLPPWQVSEEFVTGLENMTFRDGIIKRISGQRSVYETVQADVLSLINTRIGTTNYWVYHGTDKSYAVSSAGHNEITLAAGLTAVTAAHQWSAASLNGVVVANNSVDPPMYWDGNPANAMLELPDWPSGSLCDSLTSHLYHLFALGMRESGGDFLTKVMWSDAASPGTVPQEWASAADNQAGSAELSDDDSQIQCGVTQGESLLVYKSSALYAIDYVGGQNIYEPRPVFFNRGALTRRAVCDIGRGRQLAVGDGDVYLTDGVGYQSIADRKVRRWIFDSLDQDNYEMLQVAPLPFRNEVLVCWPGSGNSLNNQGAIYSIDFNEWGLRDLPDISCAALGIDSSDAPSDVIDDQSAVIDTVNTPIDAQNFSAATESLLVGDPGTPSLIHLDTEDSVAVAAKIKAHDLDLGEPGRVKLVKRVHLLARDYGTLYVRIGSKMRPDDSITWSDEITLTHPASVADTFAQGVFISLEIRSTDAAPWGLSAYGLEYERRGYR